MNFLSEFNLSFDPNRLGDGGVIAIVGISVVFAVLAIIWLVLLAFNLVFNKLNLGQRKSDKIKYEAQPVAEVQPVSNDEEIIAVIAAAIAMAESEAPGSSFKVVSFKRV